MGPHGTRMGDTQQAPLMQPATGPDAPKQDRGRGGKHQRHGHRQGPVKKCRIEPPGKTGPAQRQQCTGRLIGEGVAPSGLIAAVLARPAQGGVEQCLQHIAGMRQHADRREQCGHQALQQDAGSQARRATMGMLAPVEQRIRCRQQLGKKQQQQGHTHQGKRAHRIPFRPDGKRAVRDREIIYGQQREACRGDGGQHQEGKPQGRGQVGHDAVEQGHAVRQPQTRLGQQDPEVLQVALGPAPVAGQFLHQGGRRFLVTAGESRFQPDLLAGASHVGRLDEVVAADRPAEQTRAVEFSQPAMGHEGRVADDGIVSPVGRFAQLVGRQAAGEDRTVDLTGKLLHPGEGGFGVGDGRAGLEDAHARLPLHEAHHVHQGLACHEAVGIQHDHVTVGTAPAAQKIGDVAALVMQVHGATAIEQAPLRTQFPAQAIPGLPFRKPHLRIPAVGEDEEIKGVQGTGPLQGLVTGAQPVEGALHGLMVDGHHHGRARQRDGFERRRRMPVQQ